MHLDAATILLQWAAGGLAFLWVTTRGRLVSLGYGWLLRGIYAVMGVGAIAAELRTEHRGLGHSLFLGGSAALVGAALVALVVSVLRRRAGVSGADALAAALTERVAVMAGRAESEGPERVDDPARAPREFPPGFDLLAPSFGVLALVGAAQFSGGAVWLAAVRLVVGAAFLGVVSDAMLLGHWYLTQPGLPRDPLKELVRWAGYVWPVEVLVLLLPPGMIGVLGGSRSDG